MSNPFTVPRPGRLLRSLNVRCSSVLLFKCHLINRAVKLCPLFSPTITNVDDDRWVKDTITLHEMYQVHQTRISAQTSSKKKNQLTPEFVVVGATASLSTAVSRLTQVSSIRVGPGAVPWSPQQGQAATGVVLHCTPALPGLSPTPPLPTYCKLLTIS